MRRIQPLFEISPFYPWFFWQRCDICHEEFKEEYAWRVRFPHAPRRTICSKCAPLIEIANELAMSWGEDGRSKMSARALCKRTDTITEIIKNTPPPPRRANGKLPFSP